MKHTNLYVKVGRAQPQPLCTVDQEHPNHDLLIDQAKRRSLDSLCAGGVDSARVEFVEESVDVDSLIAAEHERATAGRTIKKARTK